MVGFELRVLPAARRHGASDADIMHAYQYALHAGHAPGHPDGEALLVIGPSLSAALLELVVIDAVDGPLVIHAMPLRRAYEQFLDIRRRT